jgi:hypothetical protein
MTEAAETPEEAVTRELSRRVSLEVRRFPTQEIPQALSYRCRKDLPENLPQDLPEDCYLPEDLSYQ